MHAIVAKMPELCGYLLILLAGLLMGYTAACAPRPQEQWNSYYYGTGAQSHGLSYYGGNDTDDNYRLPDSYYRGDERSLQVDGALHGTRMR